MTAEGADVCSHGVLYRHLLYLRAALLTSSLHLHLNCFTDASSSICPPRICQYLDEDPGSCTWAPWICAYPEETTEEGKTDDGRIKPTHRSHRTASLAAIPLPGRRVARRVGWRAIAQNVYSQFGLSKGIASSWVFRP